jgi:hypothetical protein
VTATVKVAHVRLCHNPMLFICADPRKTQEIVFLMPAGVGELLGRSPIVATTRFLCNAWVSSWPMAIAPAALRGSGYRDEPAPGCYTICTDALTNGYQFEQNSYKALLR